MYKQPMIIRFDDDRVLLEWEDGGWNSFNFKIRVHPVFHLSTWEMFATIDGQAINHSGPLDEEIAEVLDKYFNPNAYNEE